MSKQELFIEAHKLPPAERMQLMEELWDSLADQELSDAQKAELDKRISNPEQVKWVSFNEVDMKLS